METWNDKFVFWNVRILSDETSANIQVNETHAVDCSRVTNYTECALSILKLMQKELYSWA